jgi:UDP-N-acetylmuramyl pentapeptide phosphotransferase/UDP-N-acetylglucosamine-1-phosphate transferase
MDRLPLVMVLSTGTSFLVTLWLVWTAGHNGHFLADHDLSGPQKFHARPVPRVGGLSLALGLLAATAWMCWDGQPEGPWSAWLLLCAVPAFGSGSLEDVTKKVSARVRLYCTMGAAALAVWLMESMISRSGISALDVVIGFAPVAFVLTLVVVGGVANSVNIIDGFNGLASMCSALIFGAIAYVAMQVGDTFVLSMALACLGAILGFFVFNYPAGLIFLGDGGAYLLGFMLAELALLLVHRNEAVSPMFALLVCIYPVFETGFSMYRRKVVRKMPSMAADGIHLHSLIYRRVMRWAAGDRTPQAMTRRNSMMSPYLWALCTLSVVPAVLFWRHTGLLLMFLLLFGMTYVAMYASIVRFKTPKWLVFRGGRKRRR